MELDWEECRIAALRLSSVLLQNIQQTQGRGSTVGNVSMTVPTTRAPDLDQLHHVACQKILDFLSTDQFDAGLELRVMALETTINIRTPKNLTSMVAEHNIVADFRQAKQNQYQREIGEMQQQLTKAKQKNLAKPTNALKDEIRVLTMQLKMGHRKNTATIPVTLMPQIWESLIHDTILAAEKTVSVGALYVREQETPITTQQTISRDAILAHRQTSVPVMKRKSRDL